MSHLYVIGNGFDCHHDINSQYSEFRNWLEETDNNVSLTIEELFGEVDDDWWSVFEENLSNAITSDRISEAIEENYPDYGSDDYHDADMYDAEYEVENILNYAYQDITDAFQDWIDTLDSGNTDKMIQLVRTDSRFLNFNYTTTLENLYGIAPDRVFHIHGKSGGGNLILGHGASQNEIEAMIEADLPENLDADDYVTRRCIEGAVRGVYEKRKKTDEIIRANEEWFNSLNDVTDLHFYGFSFADVDLPYVRKILDSVDRNNLTIEVSAHSERDRRKINSFFRSIGIQNYNIISLNDILEHAV